MAKKRAVSRAAVSAKSRHDCVMIRKSGSTQDEVAQAKNVRSLLTEQGIELPSDCCWYYCVVPRKDVDGNRDFKRLMDAIEAREVRTVYVEMQDRFGTDNVAEIFAMISRLRSCQTRLFDLRDKLDLMQKDDATLFQIFINAVKSSKERIDLAFRSMRTKVPLLLEMGSWPSGSQPFGFGKRCYQADGRTLIWEWQPTSRTKGDLFYPTDNGKLRLGTHETAIPRKEKGKRHVTKLVPSKNSADVKTVRLIFEYFTRHGLSYRMISRKLNEGGRKYYGKSFTHALVAQILVNQAYVGDTVYGKTETASHFTFDVSGNIVAKKDDLAFDDVAHDSSQRVGKRGAEDQLIKRTTHKGLIDRKTWKMAQDRLASMEERPAYTPRNPKYYLKTILVCGHCGKNMTGTTEGGNVVYYCSTYKKAKNNGQIPNPNCGAYRIHHSNAEKLMMDKLNEMNLEYDALASQLARDNAVERTEQLDNVQWNNYNHDFALMMQGLDALEEYYVINHGGTPRVLTKLHREARKYYAASPERQSQFPKRLRDVIQAAEVESTTAAEAKVSELKARHAKKTRQWSDATNLMRATLRQDCESIEAELKTWEPRMIPFSQRIAEVLSKGRSLADQTKQVETEMTTAGLYEKGEALRRVFKCVKLYWDAEFVTRSDKPKRPLKTNRPGRYSYKLKIDEIQWEFAALALSHSS